MNEATPIRPATVSQLAASSEQFQNLHELVQKARANLDQNAWDYIVGGAETETTLRRNRINQTRLRTVLQFLLRHEDEFTAVPMASLEEDHESAVTPTHPAISVSARQAIARMAENAINDLIWWY